MGKTVEKIADLEYNELLTLGIIEKEPDLTKIFREDIELPFTVLFLLSKNNQLTTEHKAIIRGFFDFVILVKKELIQKYLRLANDNGETITNLTLENAEIENPVIAPISTSLEEEDKIIEESNEVITQSPIKAKKEKTLPRRYGKEKITKDIEVQGGKATPLQTAMLRINDLKNIYVNLSARGIKDMFGDTTLLSDSDCREITAAITIVERKLEGILKRKK